MSSSKEPSKIEKSSAISETHEDGKSLGSDHVQPLQRPLSSEKQSQDGPDLGKFPAQRRRSKFHRSSSGGPPNLVSDKGNDMPGPTRHPSSAIPSHPTNEGKPLQNVQESENKQGTIKTSNRSSTPQSQPQTQPTQVLYAKGVGPSLPNPPASIPEPQQARGTIWPEASKLALARAAVDALTSTAVNVGRTISTEEITLLLDRNPSYAQLCENLECKGFIIDRRHFARLLLTAVPGLNSSQSHQETVQPKRDSSVNTSTTNGREGTYQSMQDWKQKSPH